MIIRAVSKSAEFDFSEFVTFFADIQVTSVKDLVYKISQMCPKRELQELALYAHGSDGSFTVGADHVCGIYAPGKDPLYKFEPLKDYFFSNATGRASLILCVCEAGKNERKLSQIASVIRAPVFACTGDVLPVLGLPRYGYWAGRILAAYPNEPAVVTVNKIPDPPLILA